MLYKYNILTPYVIFSIYCVRLHSSASNRCVFKCVLNILINLHEVDMFTFPKSVLVLKYLGNVNLL